MFVSISNRIFHLILFVLWFSTEFKFIKSEDGSAEGARDFPDLFKLAKSKKLQLTYKIHRGNETIRVREFLDLVNWRQALEFSWTDPEIENAIPWSARENIIILNDLKDFSKYVFKYRHFSCGMDNFNKDHDNQEGGWFEKATNVEALSKRERFKNIIETLIVNNIESPYYYIKTEPGADHQDFWVFGAAAIWLKAEKYKVSKGPEGPEGHSYSIEFGDFRVRFEFYESDTSHELVQLKNIQLSISSSKDVIDYLDIMDCTFDIDNIDLEHFNLPLGHDCPADPIATRDNRKILGRTIPVDNIFINAEILALRYSQLTDIDSQIVTNRKSLNVACTRHPLELGSKVRSFHVYDDETRIIQDFLNNLAYNISTKTNTKCEISKIAEDTQFTLKFSNGLSLSLNSEFLILMLSRSDDLRLLKIDHSLEADQYFYDTGLKDNEIKTILKAIKSFEVPEIQDNSEVSLVKRFKKDKKSDYDLQDVTIFIFNPDRTQLLAEFRLNFIEWSPLYNKPKISKIFDTTECRFKEDMLEFHISYPADSIFLELAESSPRELIEFFYMTTSSWFTLATSKPEERIDKGRIEKLKLGMSLNALRMTDVKVLSRPELGLFELHVKLLDKVSSVYSFDNIVGKTFETNSHEDQRFLVQTVDECAHLCRVTACQLFSYDTSRLECKLCRSISDYDTIIDLIMNKLISSEHSTTYYNHKRKANQLEEARLVDFISYLEHHPLNTNFSVPPVDVKFEASLFYDYPLFTFRAIDPVMGSPTMLVPDRVSIHKLATNTKSLSIDRQDIGSAFKTTLIDMRYVLPDDKSNIGYIYDKTKSDRYYLNNHKGSMNLNECSELCLDFDEFDYDQGDLATCTSFSYVLSDQTCTLLIQLKPTSESSLFWPTNPIDISTITKMSDILSSKEGAIIAHKNYLASFEPYVLVSDDSKLPQTDLNITSEIITIKGEPYEIESSCAFECLNLYKNGKICLGLELCEGTSTCKLIQVNQKSNEKNSNRLNHILFQLSNVPISEQLLGSSKSCRRHLISHASHFKPLDQRKLNSKFRLKSSGEIQDLGELNLRSCLNECYMVHQSNCIMFEHCISRDAYSGHPSESCSLFLYESKEMKNWRMIYKNLKQNSTQYDPGCHIYVKKLDHKEIEESDYGLLITAFVLLYLALTTVFCVRCYSRNKTKWQYREQSRVSARINQQLVVYELRDTNSNNNNNNGT